MSLSGDSFDVTLENGQPLIKVEGKLFSVLAQRKTVRDMQGNHLFDIEKEVMHVHTTFALKDPNGNKFMEVKSSIKRMSYLPLFWFFFFRFTRLILFFCFFAQSPSPAPRQRPLLPTRRRASPRRS